ncbi:MAG: SH3 domain-containing protein [Emcibacteraceae bacterium]|nr:SH3 domain-containing protein [Emcibacteraceae bacterium]
MRLRENASVDSEILDEMRIGQVVTVVSSVKYWTQVMYENEEGEVCTGWVSTRLVAKFRNKSRENFHSVIQPLHI